MTFIPVLMEWRVAGLTEKDRMNDLKLKNGQECPKTLAVYTRRSHTKMGMSKNLWQKSQL